MARATCQICDGPLPPRARSLCGAECRRLRNNERAIQNRRAKEAREGRPWHEIYAEQRRAHRKVYRWRERFPEEAARHDATRRARKIGATVGEPFTNGEIFERDGWRCGLCGDGIDQARAWPDPGSASLDHVLPLSKGGAHSRENVQASHLGCNVSKNNRVRRPT